jgi:hypothetical protein
MSFNDSPLAEVDGVFLFRTPNPTQEGSVLTRNASLPLIEFSPLKSVNVKRSSSQLEVPDFSENILNRRSQV